MRPEAHKGALVAIGVIAIVVGALSALAGLAGTWMVVARASLGAGAEGMAWVAGLAVALFYGLAALSLIWLGIGTLRPRRWGRALLLVSSWMWLAIDGLLACAVVVAIASQGRPKIGFGEGILLIPVIGVALLVFVGMPLAFVLVLGRPGMKEAVEQLDPTPRWTDRRPLPILGTSLALLWLSFVYALFACGDATLWHLAGSSAKMGYALLSLLMLVCAVGLWRGLQITLAITALVFVGAVVSLSANLWESAGFWPFLVAVPMYVAGAAFLWRLRRHVVLTTP
jgi:hypothetical protein